jgi:hypothetical protein
MRPTQSSVDEMTLGTRTPASQRRLRDRWMLGIPVLLLIALCHLATCWNSLQATSLGGLSHRITHVVRTDHPKLASTTASLSETFEAPDDERALDPSAVPAPWPYGAGWR